MSVLLCAPSLEVLDPVVVTMLLLLKEFPESVVVSTTEFGDFLLFIQFWSNRAMFSALDAYNGDVAWFGVVALVIKVLRLVSLSGNGLSSDNASHKACLAMWISV